MFSYPIFALPPHTLLQSIWNFKDCNRFSKIHHWECTVTDNPLSQHHLAKCDGTLRVLLEPRSQWEKVNLQQKRTQRGCGIFENVYFEPFLGKFTMVCIPASLCAGASGLATQTPQTSISTVLTVEFFIDFCIFSVFWSSASEPGLFTLVQVLQGVWWELPGRVAGPAAALSHQPYSFGVQFVGHEVFQDVWHSARAEVPIADVHWFEFYNLVCQI